MTAAFRTGQPVKIRGMTVNTNWNGMEVTVLEGPFYHRGRRSSFLAYSIELPDSHGRVVRIVAAEHLICSPDQSTGTWRAIEVMTAGWNPAKAAAA